MAGQMMLKQTISIDSTRTLVGTQDDEKILKLSPAPSLDSLKKLEGQNELAKSVPAVDGLQSLDRINHAALMVAQKAAAVLVVPKKAVVREPKVVTPFESAGVLEAGASTLVSGHVDSHAVRTGTSVSAYVGGCIGANVAIGSSVTIMAHTLPQTAPGGVYAGAIIGAVAAAGAGFFGGAFVGGKVENYVSAKIRAGNNN